MTQATAAQWDSILANFRIEKCEEHANFIKKLDDLGEIMASLLQFLGLPVVNEPPTESESVGGVYDNDNDEDDDDDDDDDDATLDRVLTVISKFRIENREMDATQHKKLDDLTERMTLIEQFLGRPGEDEAPVESCVYDNEDEDNNDNDAPFDRVRAAFEKLFTEFKEQFDIKLKKFEDLKKRVTAIVQ